MTPQFIRHLIYNRLLMRLLLLSSAAEITRLIPLWTLPLRWSREVAAIPLGAAGPRHSSCCSGYLPGQSQLLADGEEGRGRATPQEHIQDGREGLLQRPREQVEELHGSQGRVSECTQPPHFCHPSITLWFSQHPLCFVVRQIVQVRQSRRLQVR